MKNSNNPKRWCLLLLAILLFCGGCTKETVEEDGGYKLYCVNSDGTALKGTGYVPQMADAEELVKELLNAMAGEISSPDCESVFPQGLSVKVSTLKDGRLTIDFNDIYVSMDAVEEVLFRAAVVQTLTQIPEVEEVVFTIGGEALLNSDNEAVGPMQASTFLDAKEDISAYQYENLNLYFTDLNWDQESESETEKTKGAPQIGVDPGLTKDTEKESSS